MPTVKKVSADKRKRALHDPNSLARAVNDVTLGRLSYRLAEAVYGIKKSTLRDHVTGKSVSSKIGRTTLFTDKEERHIVQYALDMAAMGFPLRAGDLIEEAGKMLKRDPRRASLGPKGKPGKKILKFFKD